MKTKLTVSFEKGWNIKKSEVIVSDSHKLIMKQRKDPLAGKRFGHLIVRWFHHKDNYGHQFYTCRCSCKDPNCKRIVIARKDSLLRGEYPKCN